MSSLEVRSLPGRAAAGGAGKSLLAASSSSASGTTPPPLTVESFILSEREYTESLVTLIDAVRSLKHPLSQDETKAYGIVPDDASIAEFANVVEQLIEPLVTASESLLERLAPDPEMNNQSVQLVHSEAWPASLFLLGPLRSMAVYQLYCDKFEWLQDFLRAKGNSNVLKISQQLDIPLRRLQDYHRIVHAILASVPHDAHPLLWKELESMLRRIHIQASQELMKESSRREIMELGSAFQKQIPLYNPHRVLLRKDSIDFQAETQTFESVIGILLNDALLICSNSPSEKTPDGKTDKLSLISVITLRRCDVPELFENKNEIQFESTKPGSPLKEKTSYCLKFSSQTLCALWHFQLQNAIQGAKVEAELESKDWQTMNSAIKMIFGSDRSMSKFVDAETMLGLLKTPRRGSKEEYSAKLRSSSANPGTLKVVRRRSNRLLLTPKGRDGSEVGEFNCPLCLRKRSPKEPENLCSECGKDVCSSCCIIRDNGARVCEECNIVMTL